jgi:hypothetical protein
MAKYFADTGSSPKLNEITFDSPSTARFGANGDVWLIVRCYSPRAITQVYFSMRLKDQISKISACGFYDSLLWNGDFVGSSREFESRWHDRKEIPLMKALDLMAGYDQETLYATSRNTPWLIAYGIDDRSGGDPAPRRELAKQRVELDLVNASTKQHWRLMYRHFYGSFVRCALSPDGRRYAVTSPRSEKIIEIHRTGLR